LTWTHRLLCGWSHKFHVVSNVMLCSYDDLCYIICTVLHGRYCVIQHSCCNTNKTFIIVINSVDISFFHPETRTCGDKSEDATLASRDEQNCVLASHQLNSLSSNNNIGLQMETVSTKLTTLYHVSHNSQNLALSVIFGTGKLEWLGYNLVKVA